MKALFHIELEAAKTHAEPDPVFLKQRAATAIGVSMNDILSCRITKRSLDARKKPQVKILYAVLAEIREGVTPSRKFDPAPEEQAPWQVPEHIQTPQNPIVIGAGPAGLFAALVLSEAGCKPVVLERGYDVQHRKMDIDRFFETRKVNPESNLLFGEGGAGTWSDGKLFTRVRDIRADYVMRNFVVSGASPEIMYYAHPHLGSDKLPGIISGIRNRIVELGGTFHWGSKVESVNNKNGTFCSVKLTDGTEITGPALIAAGGHSAHELIHELIRAGAAYRMKGFQLGCRIEHYQEFINRMQFGTGFPVKALGAAEYLLSSRPQNNGRIAGATSFCMCPGGEIIPAVCKAERLSTNGMSNAARSGTFANSAIVTTIPEDMFESPESAFAFLDELEENAYRAGGNGFTAPAQTVQDFINGSSGRLPKETSYRFGLCPARLDSLLPPPCADSLKAALLHFEHTAHGFARYGTLIGIETHVSSPVRFERDPETKESSIRNLYICGEGGGTAGGIVSAGVDGVVCAEAWLRKFTSKI